MRGCWRWLRPTGRRCDADRGQARLSPRPQLAWAARRGWCWSATEDLPATYTEWRRRGVALSETHHASDASSTIGRAMQPIHRRCARQPGGTDPRGAAPSQILGRRSELVRPGELRRSWRAVEARRRAPPKKEASSAPPAVEIAVRVQAQLFLSDCRRCARSSAQAHASRRAGWRRFLGGASMSAGASRAGHRRHGRQRHACRAADGQPSGPICAVDAPLR